MPADATPATMAAVPQPAAAVQPQPEEAGLAGLVDKAVHRFQPRVLQRNTRTQETQLVGSLRITNLLRSSRSLSSPKQSASQVGPKPIAVLGLQGSTSPLQDSRALSRVTSNRPIRILSSFTVIGKHVTRVDLISLMGTRACRAPHTFVRRRTTSTSTAKMPSNTSTWDIPA
jgi:hypothetical protein